MKERQEGDQRSIAVYGSQYIIYNTTKQRKEALIEMTFFHRQGKVCGLASSGCWAMGKAVVGQEGDACLHLEWTLSMLRFF